MQPTIRTRRRADGSPSSWTRIGRCSTECPSSTVRRAGPDAVACARGTATGPRRDGDGTALVPQPAASRLTTAAVITSRRWERSTQMTIRGRATTCTCVLALEHPRDSAESALCASVVVWGYGDAKQTRGPHDDCVWLSGTSRRARWRYRASACAQNRRSARCDCGLCGCARRLRFDAVCTDVGSATDIVREPPFGAHVDPIALLLVGCHNEASGAGAVSPESHRPYC